MRDLLQWKDPKTWGPFLSDLLDPLLRPGFADHLRRNDLSGLYADDPGWLDLLTSELDTSLDDVLAWIADALQSRSMRTFHGCRPDDVHEYFQRGIRSHNRDDLIARVRQIVSEVPSLRWMRKDLDSRITEFDSQLDQGKVYVVLDDRALIEFAGHYMIYGSEWICAVLGPAGRTALLNRGTPTVLEVELPLKSVSHAFRRSLAEDMLTEWTRQKAVAPKRVVTKDFTFILHHDIAPELIVGHSHPASIPDPFYLRRPYRVDTTQCSVCSNLPTA